MSRDGSWQPSRRDRLAQRLANAALRIATQGYRDRIEVSIRYGMDAAARDSVEGREPPPSWWTHARP